MNFDVLIEVLVPTPKPACPVCDTVCSSTVAYAAHYIKEHGDHVVRLPGAPT